MILCAYTQYDSLCLYTQYDSLHFFVWEINK